MRADGEQGEGRWAYGYWPEVIETVIPYVRPKEHSDAELWTFVFHACSVNRSRRRRTGRRFLWQTSLSKIRSRCWLEPMRAMPVRSTRSSRDRCRRCAAGREGGFLNGREASTIHKIWCRTRSCAPFLA